MQYRTLYDRTPAINQAYLYTLLQALSVVIATLRLLYISKLYRGLPTPSRQEHAVEHVSQKVCLKRRGGARAVRELPTIVEVVL